MADRLPGEAVCVDMPCGKDGESKAVLLTPVDTTHLPVSFTLTTYRLTAVPSLQSAAPISVPLMAIESHETGREGHLDTLTIQTKTVWSFTFGFTGDVFHRVIKTLALLAKPSALQRLPAFDIHSCLKKGDTEGVLHADVLTEDAGWSLLNTEREMNRQLCGSADREGESDLERCGVGKDLRPWYRYTDLKQPTNTYGTFATYPDGGIVAPNSVSDDHLLRGAVFRSRARIPAVTYVHLRTGAVLARSSQPMLRGQNDDARFLDATLCNSLVNAYTEQTTKARSIATDKKEKLSATAAHRDPSNRDSKNSGGSFVAPPSLLDNDDGWTDVKSTPATTATASRFVQVVDLRPQRAATGNLAMGGGYESGAYYGQCKVTFAGIDNIHGVNNAWWKLRALVNGHAGRFQKTDFYEHWAATKWPGLLQTVLAAGAQIADFLDRGESVLTHCTDGWDRTSQCCALAMLLLDPHYRTVKGFSLLVEKEFCSYGHKFAERCGHELPGETCGTSHLSAGFSDVDQQKDSQGAQGGGHKKHTSPVFIQWLDCVFQLWREFPSRFEFTSALLVFLAENLYSCYYGTFLANCAKERVLEGVRVKTVSIWSEIHRRCVTERSGEAKRNFLNALYDAEKEKGRAPRLYPSFGSKRVVLWEDFYLRHDPDLWRIERSAETALMERIPVEAEDPTATAWQEAATRRVADVVRLNDALEKRDANIAAREMDTKADPVVVDTKAKQCWKCHEKFGLFRSSQACGGCRRLHCFKCLTNSLATNDRRCQSCLALVEDA